MPLACLMIALAAASAAPQVGLQVEQTLAQASAEVRSCTDDPATTTATLRLQGSEPVAPLDLVLVLDRSSSEDLPRVQQAAAQFIDHLDGGQDDRVALVSFADVARLEQGFSSDFDALKDAVAALRGGRLTALGDALALALDELDAQGRDEAERAVVVLSDGGATAGLDPLAQAERAGELGLPVYFVGIGAKANRGNLSELAKRAGGRFFADASTQSRVGVLKRLGRELVAQFVEVIQTLPAELSYAGVPEGALEPTVSHNLNHTTELAWAFDVLVSGQVWETQFELVAERAGTFALAREAFVRYLDETGGRQTQTIPRPELTATGTPPPAVSFEFNPEQPKANQAIQFFDRTARFGRELTSWRWDFGDGTTSTEQNPVHVYRDIGRYSVTLEVSDGSCTTRGERTFRLAEFQPGPELNIVFDPRNLRPDRKIPFSVAPLGDIRSCRWDFGDGASSDQCSTDHTYNDAGNYTVEVVVTFNDGRTLRLRRLITVARPEPITEPGDDNVDGQQGTRTLPPVDIEPDIDRITRGQAVTFSVPNPPEGDPVCDWNFGDGSEEEDTSTSVEHTYDTEGSYTVKVICTVDNGRSEGTLDVNVLGNVAPVADFTWRPLVPRVGRPVAFDGNASQDEDGSIAAWSWDFDDGNTSTDPNPIHEYAAPGVYQVQLTVTDDSGVESDPVSKTVRVGLLPEAFRELALDQGPTVPEWMGFYIDGGVVTDEELDDAARRFANGSFVQGTQYRLTEADLRALTELHDLRVITQKYLDPEEAEADGYEAVPGPPRPRGVREYVNREIVNSEKPPRFDQIPILIYAPDEEGVLKLAGVRYVTFEQDEAELFGLTDWAAFTPPEFESPVSLLTVWIWRENPDGMFNPRNPALGP